MVAATPSAMVIMTAREWATTSCISRAIRLRSLAAARSAVCSRSSEARAERASTSASRCLWERALSPTSTPIILTSASAMRVMADSTNV